MKRVNLANLTLAMLVASCFIQIGAQLFALVVIARTVSAAPPRSLAILEGEYAYDSSVFWQTVPPVTAALFLLAVVANWKTRRRGLLLGAFALFLIGGVVAGVFLEPLSAEIIAIGYADAVDPELQRRAAFWYKADWGVWCLSVAAGVALLVALTRTVTDRAVTGREDG